MQHWPLLAWNQLMCLPTRSRQVVVIAHRYATRRRRMVCSLPEQVVSTMCCRGNSEPQTSIKPRPHGSLHGCGRLPLKRSRAARESCNIAVVRRCTRSISYRTHHHDGSHQSVANPLHTGAQCQKARRRVAQAVGAAVRGGATRIRCCADGTQQLQVRLHSISCDTWQPLQ